MLRITFTDEALRDGDTVRRVVEKGLVGMAVVLSDSDRYVDVLSADERGLTVADGESGEGERIVPFTPDLTVEVQ